MNRWNTISGAVGNPHNVGLRSQGAYQVSGHPYVTGSRIRNGGVGPTEHTVSFPYVTKKVTIRNIRTTGTKNLRVRLVSTASQTGDEHYVTVAVNSSVTLDIKCKELYLTGYDPTLNDYRYEVYASLTNIPTTSMYALTGSGISE